MDFSMYKQYIMLPENEDVSLKHVFYQIPQNDIDEAEQLLTQAFPSELRDFFAQIGYGFLCQNDKRNTNRIMHPRNIYEFYKGIEFYENDDRREFFTEEGFVPFFEINNNDMLTIQLANGQEKGGSIFFYDIKIADSLHEFLEEMDKQPDYYLHLLR